MRFIPFQKWNLCAWVVLSTGMPAIVFAGYPSCQYFSTPYRLPYAFFETLGRILWAIAICYVIFACVHGSGGPINTFLSLPMWQPLAKLSYGIYLCNWTVIAIIMFSTKIPLYFNEFTAFQNFISFFVLSTLVAVLLTLAFEIPIDAIIKSNRPKDE